MKDNKSIWLVLGWCIVGVRLIGRYFIEHWPKRRNCRLKYRGIGALKRRFRKLFTGQELKGAKKDYDDLQRAFQITIIGKKSFFPDGDFFHCFEYYDPLRRMSLGGKTQIITLELSKLEGVAEKPTGEMSAPEYWAVFFRYLRDKGKRQKIREIIEREEGIAMATKVMMEISKDENERARLLSEYKFQMDWQSKIVHAEREGRKEGRQEGLQEGEQKGMRKIINLLKSGKSPEDIIKEFP